MIEIIILICFSISILILLLFLIKENKNKKLALSYYFQSEIDNNFLNKQIENLINEIKKYELSESDGFIKFISDSRDWAFNYIEQVQSAIKEFDNVIVPIIEWNETYGTVLGDDIFSEKIKEISLAYEKLHSLLPKDDETPNN